MNPQQQMYAFMAGLLDLVWIAWPIVGPFVLMGVVVKVVRWAWSSARGERDTLDELTAEGVNNVQGLQNRIDYGHGYGPLRRQGFSNAELRRARGQSAGGRFRW